MKSCSQWIVGAAIVSAALGGGAASAATVIYSQDFQAYNGGGFLRGSTANALDSNAWIVRGMADPPSVDVNSNGKLDFGDTALAAGAPSYARGSSLGAESLSGIWDFQPTSGNHALGLQPFNNGNPIFTNLVPGFVELRVSNNTGSTLTQLVIGYDVFVFNDKAGSSSFNFSWSTDDTSFTPVSALDLSTPTTSTGESWSAAQQRAVILAGLSLSPGDFIYFKWSTDHAGGGTPGSTSYDQIALDNVVVAVPEPGTLALLAVCGLAAFRRRRR